MVDVEGGISPSSISPSSFSCGTVPFCFVGCLRLRMLSRARLRSSSISAMM